MADIDPDVIDEIAKTVSDIYGDAVSRMLKIVQRRLARGITDAGWAENKLLEMLELRSEVSKVLAGLRGQEVAATAIREAFAVGREAATDELKLAADIMTPRSNPKAVEVLARETVIGHRLLDDVEDSPRVARMVADLQARIANNESQILRSTMDVYRSVVSEVSAPGVVTGTETRRQATQRALDRFAARGVTGFVDKAGRNWEIESYTEMATRTGSGRAMIDGRMEVYEADGRNFVIVSDAPEECSLCLVPGTVVAGPMVEGASRSEYAGDVLTITTAAGNELTGTPEHTVLTLDGWRRLQDLSPGDEVVSHRGQQWDPGVVPHDVQVPSLIEDALHPGSPLLLSGPARRDLDSDVVYREVQVVAPDGFLRRPLETTFGQPLSELDLVVRPEFGVALAGGGGLLESLFGWGDAAGCGMCWAEHRRSLLGGGVRPSLTHAGADHRGPLLMSQGLHVPDDAVMSRASLDAGSLQVVADGAVADIEGGAELRRRLAGQVAPDKIISIGRREFRGHVWDLQTDQRWFIANGIVTHNCRPFEGKLLSINGEGVGTKLGGIPVVDTVRGAQSRGFQHPNCRHDLRPFIPGLTRPMTNTKDPAGDTIRTEQRRLERQKRALKRREAVQMDDAGRKRVRSEIRGVDAELREITEDRGAYAKKLADRAEERDPTSKAAKRWRSTADDIAAGKSQRQGKRLRYREQVGKGR